MADEPGNDGEAGETGALGGLLGRLARSMGPGGVELGGDRVRLEQEPERGLEVRVTLLDDDGEVISVASILLPGDEPAPAHPEDVPFVPRAPLRVIRDFARDVLLAMWMLDTDDAPDPETAVAAVVRASRERGWRLQEQGWRRQAGGRLQENGPAERNSSGAVYLRREDRVRRIELTEGGTGPVVALSEKRLR